MSAETVEQCAARIAPFVPIHAAVVECREPAGHAGKHQGVIADYAYPGSRTILSWLDSDRRNFTGEWIECPLPGCILPAGHPREHAS